VYMTAEGEDPRFEMKKYHLSSLFFP